MEFGLTVVMVGIYRTPQALRPPWKYFILGSVGIALAFFGTILVYLAQGVLGEGLPAMSLTRLIEEGARFDPALLNLASSSSWSATAPRSGWCRSTLGCLTPMPRARRRSRPCSPVCS